MSRAASAAESLSDLTPYAQAARVPSALGLLFVSGQLPVGSDSGEIIEADIVGQTCQALTNALAVVASNGGNAGDVVKVTLFVRDLACTQRSTTRTCR